MALEKLLGREAVDEIRGRNFGINPNSKYSEKELLERAEELFVIDSYYKRITQNGSDISSLNGIAEIALKYMPGDKDENLKMLKNPFVAAEQARALLGAGYKNMAVYIAMNRASILKGVSEKNLLDYAKSLPNKEKDYPDLKERAGREDLDAARAAFIKASEDPAWQKFITNASEEFIAQYAIKYARRKQKEFVNKNFCVEIKDKKTKGKNYIPNRKKIEAYIDARISKQEDKTQAYVGLAQAYLQTKAEAEKEKDKKIIQMPKQTKEDSEEMPMAA